MLQEILDEHRANKNGLKRVISACFGFDWPRVQKILGDKWIELTADQIFGSNSPLVKEDDDFKIGIRPLPYSFKVGDFATMTSEGLIIGNKNSWYGHREVAILQAVISNHPNIQVQCYKGWRSWSMQCVPC